MTNKFCLVGLLMLVAPSNFAFTAEKESTKAARLIEQFSATWDEAKWTGGRRPYIRSLDDDAWKLRFRTLQGLSELSANAEAQLFETLESADAPARILAAQAMGFLGTSISATRLLDLAQKEPDASVRLYLVDAIAMAGASVEVAEALRNMQKQESNRDVIKHIGYALAREGNRVDSSVVQSLRQFAPRQMNTAELGKPAPDFRLKTVDGRVIQLSQFRGKNPVVLVFIYGDT